MVGYSLFKDQPKFALSLLVGFHGLLRTGELLSLKAKHISISQGKGPAVLSLGLTKSGKRQGAAESVTLHAEDVCRRLFQWKGVVHPETLLTGPSHVWRKQFADTLKAVHLHKFDFRPYSLRRGGATHYFQLHGRFDSLLVLGRWQAAATARIYINEGLAVLAELSLPWTPFTKNLRSQYLTSFTKPLPKLERTKKSSQNRGRWSKQKEQLKHGDVLPKKGWYSQLSCVWPDSEMALIPWPRVTLGVAGFPLGVFKWIGFHKKLLLRGEACFPFV